jgi:hypothetical protein
VVFISDQEAIAMDDRKLDDKLDPKAKGKQTPKVDFDRNREGPYGGLPEARDPAAKQVPQPRAN